MELAVNQFTKGLQVDTNPMVQGDDTLSDALNATFVTMNGNEVILLNDMGNRRVDHAFLPAGYEPVGIKEYGGVIYVASYNPITNRSQIGSFPSPERILSSLDNPDLGIDSYAFSRFFKEANIENIGGILFLKNDEFMDLLTADTSLHAGDKFSIYSGYIWKQKNQEYINQKYISHFNNWDKDNKKLISPKNKLFTLSVGVMNSLNEFVDITESLERFNKDNEIIKVENDALKLDDGYFIAPAKPTTKEEDIDRNLLAVNTYSYKLVGPLQLKTTLNHILNFDFVMDWQKGSEENLYILIIRGIATYNCPDVLITNKLTEIETEGDSEIIVEGEVEIEDSDPTIPSERKEYAKRARFDILLNTQQTIEKAFESFDVYIKNSTKLKWAKLENTPDNPNIKTILPDIKTTYDINTDLYTSTITKKYIFTGSEAYENILLYYICVKALAEPYEEEGEEYNNIYLKNLSYQGEIDLTKIGSNIVELKEYRYWYEPGLDTDGLVTMTFFTEAYPDHFTEFSDFKILLELLVSNGGNSSWEPISDSYLYEAGTVLSGRVTFSFPTTLAQTLYRVVFSYNKKSIIEEGLEEPIVIYRYLLTTELFNDCYYGSSGDYVEDYGLFMGEISGDTITYTYDTDKTQTILTGVSEELKEIRDNYLEVKLKLDGNIINKTAIPTLNTEGTFIRPKGTEEPPFEDISYKTTYSTTLDLIYNYEVAINNLENYPTYIKLSDNTQITSIGTPEINYTIEFVDQRIEAKGDYIDVLVAKVKDPSNSSSENAPESSTQTTDPTEPSTTDPTENSTSTTNNEDPTSTTDLTEASTQKEYLAEVGNVSPGENFEVTQDIKYYDIFKAGATASTEKTFGTLYVDLNNANIMKERLFRSYCSGFLVGANGDEHLFYTYPLIPGFVKTWIDYSRDLYSYGYNNLSFIDLEDKKYRMATALSTLVYQNINNNFIYMFTEVKDGDENAERDNNVHFPANGQYFVLKIDDTLDDQIDSSVMEPHLSDEVLRYYLDYYTMVFWKTNNDNNLYLLGIEPWKYRDWYRLDHVIDPDTSEDIGPQWDVYNPDYPYVSLSRRWKRAVGFHYSSTNPDSYVEYENRYNTVNEEFYQNILDFIGITKEINYKLFNNARLFAPSSISSWEDLDLIQGGDTTIRFEIKVRAEDIDIENQNINIQAGNKKIIINFYSLGSKLDPPEEGSIIEDGWCGNVVEVNTIGNITTYTINTKSDIYAYKDKYSYVVPISNYSPGDSLLFPYNNNYCYNHTYKLMSNVLPAEVKVTAELEINEKGNNLLKLELKDTDTSKDHKQVNLETEPVEIILNTDPTFEESCNSILYDDLLNDIYLETGEKVPRPGEYNNIYVSKNKGKLILVNNPPFIYSMENNSITFKNNGTIDLKPSDYLLKSVGENENSDFPSLHTTGTKIKLDLIRVITKEMLEYHAGD